MGGLDEVQMFPCLGDVTTVSITTQTKPRTHCAACGRCVKSKLKATCKGCGMIHFCSVKCQKKKWPLHKSHCEALACTRGGRTAFLTHMAFFMGIYDCGGVVVQAIGNGPTKLIFPSPKLFRRVNTARKEDFAAGAQIDSASIDFASGTVEWVNNGVSAERSYARADKDPAFTGSLQCVMDQSGVASCRFSITTISRAKLDDFIVEGELVCAMFGAVLARPMLEYDVGAEVACVVACKGQSQVRVIGRHGQAMADCGVMRFARDGSSVFVLTGGAGP